MTAPLPHKQLVLSFMHSGMKMTRAKNHAGWYLAKVLSINNEGMTNVKYHSGGLCEKISLIGR